MTIAFEAQDRRRDGVADLEATEVDAFAPEDIPWAGIAFKTTIGRSTTGSSGGGPTSSVPGGQLRSMKTFLVSV